MREHHEKSIRILNMMDECDRRIKARESDYAYKRKLFGTWKEKMKEFDGIHFQKAVKERLAARFSSMQVKYYGMIELRSLVQSGMNAAA